ncbi:YadA-like family protein [Haemophilus haemolyticus]|uniref:YadA-like family protein n=2 Tax=Haemophilus haemolyticus TaxID=726 RepID=UPI000E576552|nr:YadA-like family protein [Haemophilus haemolyticus]
MNKIFKIIWNKTTQRLEVVSELAKSQGKAAATTDNRVSAGGGVASTKGKPSFTLTLLALSMLMLSGEVFAHDYSDAASKGDTLVWGKANTATGSVHNSNYKLPIIVGAANNAGTSGANENGAAVNIFGRNNKANAGKIVTVVGTGNEITSSAATENKAKLFVAGNNVSVVNPSELGTYIGNNVSANASPLSIGNNVLTQIGGVGIGYDIELKARRVLENGSYHVIPNTTTQEPTGMALGGNIKGFGDNVYLGRSITLKPTTDSGQNIANDATKDNRNSVYVGHNITTKGAKNSVLMGQGITSNDDVGHHSVAFGTNITLGSTNKQTEDLTAIGSHINITTNAKRSVVVGSKVNASAEDAVAIGTSASAARQGDVVLGADSATTTSTNSDLSDWHVAGENLKTHYDKNDIKQTSGKGVVSVGSGTVKRQIKNVAAGDVTASSTDAVNGAQLYALSTKVGLFKIKAGDNETELTSSTDKPIKFKSENANLVVSASTTDNTVKFKLGDNLSVTTVRTTGAITATGGVNANGVTIGQNGVAINANNKKITGLADATLSATSTDAVTGKQLNQTNQNVTTAASTASSALTKATAASTAASTADSKAVAASTAASTADSKAVAASTAASTADSKAVAASTAASTADSKAVAASTAASTADSKATAASTAASTADSKAVAASTAASTADSKAVAASTAASTADSKAVAASTAASTADSKAVAASTAASTADSKATAASTAASTADSKAVAASTAASTADSKATAASTAASTADSKAVAASTAASTADSKATAASTAASTADSKAVAASTAASTADSKAEAAKEAVNRSGLETDGQNTKIGSGATYAGGSNATAIGGSAKATAENTTAVGQGSEATEKGATAIGQGAKATAENAVAIGSGSVADEAHTVSVGSQGNERRITNVAAGRHPTDAANVGQINAAENRMNNKLGKLDKKLRGGIASAVAVANIPQVTIPGANMVAVGAGNYKGQSAIAIGYSKASDNNRVIIKMSAGASTQRDYTFGAGIGYQW